MAVHGTGHSSRSRDVNLPWRLLAGVCGAMRLVGLGMKQSLINEHRDTHLGTVSSCFLLLKMQVPLPITARSIHI